MLLYLFWARISKLLALSDELNFTSILANQQLLMISLFVR